MFEKIKEMAKTNFGLVFILAVFAILVAIAGWVGNMTSILELISGFFEWGASSPASALFVWLIVSLILVWGAGRTVYNADKKTQKVLNEINEGLSETNLLVSLYRQRESINAHIMFMNRDLKEFRTFKGVMPVDNLPIHSFNASKYLFGKNLDDIGNINSTSYATTEYSQIERINEEHKPNYRRFMAEYEVVLSVMRERSSSVGGEIARVETSMVRKDNETAN